MVKKTIASKKNLIPGSKIPITYLLDYFKEGYAISDFISSYPWIKRSAIERAIEEVKRREFTSRYAL